MLILVSLLFPLSRANGASLTLKIEFFDTGGDFVDHGTLRLDPDETVFVDPFPWDPDPQGFFVDGPIQESKIDLGGVDWDGFGPSWWQGPSEEPGMYGSTRYGTQLMHGEWLYISNTEFGPAGWLTMDFDASNRDAASGTYDYIAVLENGPPVEGVGTFSIGIPEPGARVLFAIGALLALRWSMGRH
ncbi:MAG: hypothetical protein JRC77_11020 [Deltaproteobacteria bacterium]|nr:hypothetical protein [Deltaproteobacteria bacterium]